MIIKIIPETEAEKNRGKEVVLQGVKEYFICGNRLDEDSTLVDFHQWHGSHKYLIGSLHYFHEEINDQRSIDSEKKRVMKLGSRESNMPKPFIKRGEILNEKPNIGVFDGGFDPSEALAMEDLRRNADQEPEDGNAFPEVDEDTPPPVLKFMPSPDPNLVRPNRSGDMFTKEAIDEALSRFDGKTKAKKTKKEEQAGDFED